MLDQVVFEPNNHCTRDHWPRLWSEELVVIKEEGGERVEGQEGQEGKKGKVPEGKEGKEGKKGRERKEGKEPTGNAAKLSVKVWSAGRIDVAALVDRVEVFLHQAVHLYALETHYWTQPIRTCLNDLRDSWIVPIVSVMDSALALGAPNVFRIRSQQGEFFRFFGFFGFFVCFALFIDLLTDKVQPLSSPSLVGLVRSRRRIDGGF